MCGASEIIEMAPKQPAQFGRGATGTDVSVSRIPAARAVKSRQSPMFLSLHVPGLGPRNALLSPNSRIVGYTSITR
jgi:hypothetical protein